MPSIKVPSAPWPVVGAGRAIPGEPTTVRFAAGFGEVLGPHALAAEARADSGPTAAGSDRSEWVPRTAASVGLSRRAGDAG